MNAQILAISKGRAWAGRQGQPGSHERRGGAGDVGCVRAVGVGVGVGRRGGLDRERDACGIWEM